MATLVSSTVDPDGTGDYTSLSSAEASNFGATGADLVTNDEYCECSCISSSGGDDTASCDVSGQTTDATRYIEISGGDFPSGGVLDEASYILKQSSGTNGQCIGCEVDHVHFRKLQFQYTGSSLGIHAGIVFNACGTDHEIDSCIFKGIHSGTGKGYAVYAYNTSCDITNCLIYDWVSGSDADFDGIRMYASGHTINVYNCTIENCYNGVAEDNGTMNCYNTISLNNNDDFQSVSGDILYCLSDDGDDTGSSTAQSPAAGGEFNDLANEDYSLASGANAIDNGSASYAPADDIIDATRPQGSGDDIGAFEYTPSGVGPTGIMTPNTFYWGQH